MANGGDYERVIGVEVYFGADGPVSDYIYDDVWAPRLTPELIDELMDNIDPMALEREALKWQGVGEPVNLAWRTHQAMRAALHAQIHVMVSPDAGSDAS